MALLHGRGVQGLRHPQHPDLPRANWKASKPSSASVAEAGVDAVIVQDVGLARLIRAITPDLEVHGSTQMSISSVEGVRLAKELGCSRVILARELSRPRDRQDPRAASPLPVEVFVHGALCVAYSGQCLTSEALGGRSANRGECAQACRMAYRDRVRRRGGGSSMMSSISSARRISPPSTSYHNLIAAGRRQPQDRGAPEDARSTSPASPVTTARRSTRRWAGSPRRSSPVAEVAGRWR